MLRPRTWSRECGRPGKAGKSTAEGVTGVSVRKASRKRAHTAYPKAPLPRAIPEHEPRGRDIGHFDLLGFAARLSGPFSLVHRCASKAGRRPDAGTSHQDAGGHGFDPGDRAAEEGSGGLEDCCALGLGVGSAVDQAKLASQLLKVEGHGLSVRMALHTHHTHIARPKAPLPRTIPEHEPRGRDMGHFDLLGFAARLSGPFSLVHRCASKAGHRPHAGTSHQDAGGHGFDPGDRAAEEGSGGLEECCALGLGVGSAVDQAKLASQLLKV